LLGPFLNLSENSEQLALSWLAFALVPRGPFPILALSGPQGSSKSTVTKILRSLTDPSEAMLASTPKSERDLAIAASQSHVLALDNLSAISEGLSDSLCRVSTGGGYRCRELYENTREIILNFKLPCIVNGIVELPERPDLLDRSILIRLDPISEQNRRDEQTFWREFEGIRPAAFGALLTTIAAGLRGINAVKLPSLPRMSDYCRFSVAIEESLGFERDSFLAAYRDNLRQAADLALEASPITHVLEEFLKQTEVFSGSALLLLKRLNELVTPLAEVAKKNPRWPRSAQALSSEVARVEPVLARLGIEVERGRTHGGRFLFLKRRGDEAAAGPSSRANARKEKPSSTRDAA
jgi:hypothetical protein